MAKVTLTITFDNWEFDKQSYSVVYDDDGTSVDLTDEQREALTPEEMLKYDKRYLVQGEFDLSELLYGQDFDYEDDLKLEVIDE